MSEENRGFTVIDRRGREEPGEVCRVCGEPGAPEPHTRQYGQPTMDCVRYLRHEISELRHELDQMKKRYES